MMLSKSFRFQTDALPRRRAALALLLAAVGVWPALAGAEGPPQCPAALSASQALPLINALRAQPQQCGEHRMPAAPPLAWSPRLADTARQLAQDMAELNRVAHQDRDGQPLGVRLQRNGYRYLAAAENIAGGQRSVPDVLDAWLASPTHCAALMSEALSEVGLACVGRADSTYRTHWVMHLGTPLFPAAGR
jgi:uncharacterized protein YkwD